MNSLTALLRAGYSISAHHCSLDTIVVQATTTRGVEAESFVSADRFAQLLPDAFEQLARRLGAR